MSIPNLVTPDFLWKVSLGAAAFGILVVAYLFNKVKSLEVTDAKAKKISDAIREGAMAFLDQEYRIIGIVVAIIAAALAFYAGKPVAAMAFVSGSILSMVTGFIGMSAATYANVRTTMAAKDSGEREAFLTSFFGGGVMGFAVASFGILGLGVIYHFYAGHPDFVQILTSFGLGGSLVAFFARVGGGIYTKSADVGADLVGKVEAEIGRAHV